MKLHNTVYNLTMFFDFVTWPSFFVAPHISVKGWSSNKVKEYSETNLKYTVLCSFIRLY